jgi:aspartate/methionine/tyrosine aminotransferase
LLVEGRNSNMSIDPFLLERYFASYEFKAKYLLSSSDCESIAMQELIQMAEPKSLKLWKSLKLGYTESQGHPLLREEIANLYDNISPDRVLIAAPEELIFIAMQTMLKPNDHVVALSPAYQSLHEIARSIGCNLTPWTIQPMDDGWKLDFGELERSINKKTRMLVINFPHNPTGYHLSLNELNIIVELARKNGLYLFSDEMYRMLEYIPDKRLPPVCDLYEMGISLSGLSKAFSLPGLRIGWLATQQISLMEKWIAYHDYTTICNSAPGEILGIIALQNREKIINQNLEIISRNIDLARKLFDNHHEQLTWFGPQAGSVAFPKWTGEGTVEKFCQDVLEAKGVMIVPGHLFNFPGNHFRIGLGRRNLPEALEQVGEYLKKL